jgi:RNA polymerase sigma factor (sigma-70 family)
MSSASGTGVVRFIRGAADACADGPPDAELVRRFAAHSDEQAFRTLVARHAPVVWAVCWRMLRNHHDAEDAFQATFLVFARGAGGIRTGAAVGGWLCGVAGRVASRVRTKERPEPAEVEPAAGHPEGALGDLTVREAEAILYEELARLPEKYRDALVLCCLEGLTRDEAAARLGWTENQVKNCLEQGRERLRSRLARRGIALGVPLLATLLVPPVSAAPPVLAFATGSTPPAAISSLANGVTRTMWIAKWKWAAVACTALVLTAGGTVAAVLSQSQPEQPATAKPALVLVSTGEPVPVATPDAKKEQLKQPWDVATEYLSAVVNGKTEQALKYGDKLDEKHPKEIQTAGLTRVKLAMILVNDSRALVVTARDKLKRRPNSDAIDDQHVLVELERKDAASPWRVRGNDVNDEKKVLREVEDYLNGKFDFKPNPVKANEPAKAHEPRPPWFAAEEFLELALAEKTAEALKLTVPGTISENKVGEIKKAGIAGGKVVAVFINDTRMEAVFEQNITVVPEKIVVGHLVLMLTKSKDGAWQVKDVDFRDEKKLEPRIQLYLGGNYDTKAKE